MRPEVNALCARLGEDPLLVQGAGGNVSWKSGNELWIKASGTWLSQAPEKDIFVPVDLPALTTAVAAGDFGVKPRALSAGGLRPSIETVLHALMPHPVVVHVHAVEALAHLVCQDAVARIQERLSADLAWLHVDYRQPGAELAELIDRTIKSQGAVDIVFLQNHGLVVGGDTVMQVEARLRQVCAQLASPPRAPVIEGAPGLGGMTVDGKAYAPVSVPSVHSLACDPALWDRLHDSWALYPDHVVFLGARPGLFNDLHAMQSILAQADVHPMVAFVRGVGCYISSDDAGMRQAREAQLRCYHDVLARVSDGALRQLRDDDVGRLLNWDAEKYRLANRPH